MNQTHFNGWGREGFLKVFLVIIIVLLLVPHFVRDDYAYIVIQCSFFALMLLLVYSIHTSSILCLIEMSCIALFIIFDLISLYYASISHMLVAYGFGIVFLILVVFDLLKNIIYSSVISTNVIFGSLIVYFLMGILWSKIYFVENVLHPGSFYSVQNTLDFRHTSFSESYNLQFNLLYYSFCVLSTLGLGDIIPIDNQAKTFTLLEAMFGQLFLTVIIAKLVSTWRQKESGSVVENIETIINPEK